MLRYFDASFFLAGALTLAAVAVAYFALANPSLPVVGGGKGALAAIAVIGLVACSLGGLSQAPVLGWGHPMMILGSVIGIVALLVIGAGFFGWDGVVRPVAQFVPATLAMDLTTERLAIVALAAVMLLKLALDVVLAVGRGMSAS